MIEVRTFSPRDKTFLALVRRDDAPSPAEQLLAAEAVADIKRDGSPALLRRVRAGATPSFPEELKISAGEMAAARDAVSERFLTSLSLARVSLRRFHEYQRRRGYVHDEGEGVRVSRQVRPLRRVGICCGSSFLALLMHAVPAQIAGVGRIVVAAAPLPDGRVDPRILATAKSLGLEDVYRLTGAEAVAAMALGVDPVPGVDKIVGPGGPAAAAAKRLLSGAVGVDADLSRNELLVVADDTANAKFIAGDLLAQAEHESDAGLLALFTTDRLLAEAVRIELERLSESLPNTATVRDNLRRFGAIFLFPAVDAAIDAANQAAPARLALMTRANEEYLGDIDTAGAVLMGPWTTEAVGDYFSGINAFLPAGGRSRFASGLGVDDFVREMSVVEYGPDRLLVTGRHLDILAREENLPAHADAVRERLELLKLTVDREGV